MIGIIGASGTVGRHAAGMLARTGRPLRLGSRSAGTRVDVRDPESLARFADGCRVLLNCAGPSYEFVDRVAVAAIGAGADYVDASGDEPAYAALRHTASGSRVVLSAGMLPGLTGILPRLLTDGRAVDTVVWHAGGIQPVSPAAAADLVLSMTSGEGYGAGGAVWRDGQVVPGALAPRENVELAFFPGRVTAHPFLPGEAIRTATALGAREARWWNVFAGDGLRTALGAQRGRVRAGCAGPELAAIARRVRHGAQLDAVGRAPFHVLVCSVDERTIVLRSTDSYRLTAAVAAHAVCTLLDGVVPPGVHYAADVLDPRRTLQAVRRDGAVVHVEVLDGMDAGLADLVHVTEEGVL